MQGRRLQIVRRLPFARPGDGNRLEDQWVRLAESAYRDLELEYCVDPELIVDRLCIDLCACDGDRVEVIGRVALYPFAASFYQHGMAMYGVAARELLLRANASADVQAIEKVRQALALPRIVAGRISQTELSIVNPYVSVEYLRQIYAGHRGSGDWPAAG